MNLDADQKLGVAVRKHLIGCPIDHRCASVVPLLGVGKIDRIVGIPLDQHLDMAAACLVIDHQIHVAELFNDLGVERHTVAMSAVAGDIDLRQAACGDFRQVDLRQIQAHILGLRRDAQPDIGQGMSRAVVHREGRIQPDPIAMIEHRGLMCMEIKACDIQILERMQLSGLADAILVGIGPDQQISEVGILGINHTIVIRIKRR